MPPMHLPVGQLNAELLRAVEAVLDEGEGLTTFIETSVRVQVDRRQRRRDFVAKGLAAAETAKRTGRYTDAAQVVARLEGILDQASKRAGNP
ncbi:hypothetical protein [Aerosticca soli]|uniref:hypothetical protein n=1 Tax=Aerosticca soli TaxID=2010829 RepID=UPI000F844032|nr:hypothetical protein [Aerosticca soli]